MGDSEMHARREAEEAELCRDLLECLALLAATRRPLQPPLHVRSVSKQELEVDGVGVRGGVDLPVDVHGTRVTERAHHVAKGVALARRAEELVAEPFAAARALGEAGDVDPLDGGGDEARRAGQSAQPLQVRARHGDWRHVRLDGAEWEVLRRRERLPRERVEESALAHVGKADDPNSGLGAADTEDGRKQCHAHPESGRTAHHLGGPSALSAGGGEVVALKALRITTRRQHQPTSRQLCKMYRAHSLSRDCVAGARQGYR